MSLNLLKTYNPQFYQLLDWPAILRDLTRYAHFDCTREKINIPPQAKSIDEIEREFERVDYLIQLGEESLLSHQLTLSQVSSDGHYMQVVEMLCKSKVATIEELHHLASYFQIFRQLSKDLAQWNYFRDFEINPATLQKIESKFVRPLRQFVDEKGTIEYARHPLLRALYDDLLNLERDLRQNIVKIANRSDYQDTLQFKEHDVINDRYVLAVRSDSYRTVLGPIVAKSSSGMTLFVEPPELREKANTRLQLLAKIEEIIDRIAREFSAILHQHATEFVSIKDHLVGTDLYAARARYILEKDLQRPLLTEKFEFHLEGFFHPLLSHPVRNDLHLSEEQKGLIISGPNTGGKTVALKTLAICQLFIHSGLFLPIRQGTIKPVEGLFFFSSDQQNLEEGLSSFASETLSYLSLFDHFADNNLIIVDEIFNSTSSDEASALAISFLDEIHRFSSSKVFISTHHQLFKTFIHSDSTYISAHVGHDQKTHRPTYKLYYGEPGSSMAFHIFEGIAKKLGRLSGIPDRARKILDKKQVSYDRLLQELSSKKAELDRLLLENTQINVELKNQKKAAEGLAHLEKQKLVDHFREKLEKKLDQANELVRQIKAKEVEGLKSVQKMSQQLSSELNQLDPKFNQRPSSSFYLPDEISADQLIIGAKYYSELLAKEVTIESINRRKNLVTGICQKRQVHCPISSLRVLKNMPNTHKKAAETTHIHVQRTVIGKIELDGRGMRLEEFQVEVDKAIFELFNGDIPFLTIIHGHGTGVLKNWLRGHLKTIEGIRFAPDDGNDGSTRVEKIN